MIGEGPLDDFLYLGDVYPDGTSSDFLSYYAPAYGSYKSKSFPTPGNHEWANRATGYDVYWGPAFSAPHYYSFDVAGWHLVSLNSEEPTGAGSAQLEWLKTDLSSHPGTCTLAYWHRPRYAATSRINATRTLGDATSMDPIWRALVTHTSLALAGHVHNYQRLNSIDGITEIIVGTGGEGGEHHTLVNPAADARLAYANDTDFGALRLNLDRGRADYTWVNLARNALDSGTIPCKTKPGADTGAATPLQPASATLRGTADPNGSSTAYHFEYGTSTDYGAQTADMSAGASDDQQPVSADLKDLVPEETYHYRLIATNEFGTASGSDGTFTTPALSVSIDSGPLALTNDPEPSFGFSSNEAGVSFQCSIYQANVELGPCSGPGDTHGPASPLSDGSYMFQVTASDAAGKSATAFRSFTVDATAPQTMIDSGPGTLTNNAAPTFTFSSNEEASTFECRLDDGAFASCSSPLTMGPLIDGSHTFEVRATDLATNADATPASRTFTVDTVAPQTTIDSGPAEGSTIANASPSFTFSSSETGSSFECQLDGESFSSCTSPRDLSSLSDGSNTFQVRATDGAGNADATPASRTFTVDTTAPQTGITSGPPGTITTNSATFTFDATESSSTFACSLDGGSFDLCNSPKTLSGLADGPHVFQVRATDPSGNVDASPAIQGFTVSTAVTPPPPGGNAACDQAKAAAEVAQAKVDKAKAKLKKAKSKAAKKKARKKLKKTKATLKKANQAVAAAC